MKRDSTANGRECFLQIACTAEERGYENVERHSELASVHIRRASIFITT